MNSVLKRVTAAAVSLVLLFYVGFQAYHALHITVAKEQAAAETDDDTFSARGLVLRDEKLIPAAAQGIVDYTVSDGERVQKGGTVANVYPTAEQAGNEQKIRELDNRIGELQINAAGGSTMAVDINVLDADLNEKFSSLARLVESDDLTDLGGIQSDFLNLLNEKQVVTGKTTGFSDELARLEAEKQALVAKRSTSISSLVSPMSGYFVSRADGFENCYSLSNLNAITAPQITALLNAKPTAPKAAGKIVTSYEWYIVCVPATTDAQRLQVGQSVTVSFPFTAGEKLPAAVAALNRDPSGKYAVVLKCDYMTGDLAAARTGDIKITLGSYTGIRVDSGAVCFRGGQRGVFILCGNIAQFRKIDIVYAGNGYILSKYDPYDSSLLQVNDEIIIGGSNLKDGQVLH